MASFSLSIYPSLSRVLNPSQKSILSKKRERKSGGEGSERKMAERKKGRERFFSSLAVVKRELAERLEVLRDRCLLFKARSPAGERNVASVEFMRPSRRAPLQRFVILYTHAHRTALAYAHTPIESFVMSSICPSINFSSVNLTHLLSVVLSKALFIFFF